MGHFNPDEYETVDDRIHRFYGDHPSGIIRTELERLDRNEAGVERVIFSASVWRDSNRDDPAFEHDSPDAMGHAEEIRGQGMVNQTSFIENGETSAIGRALANLGYSAKGKRPSREEMQKVAAPTGGGTQTTPPPPKPQPVPAPAAETTTPPPPAPAEPSTWWRAKFADIKPNGWMFGSFKGKAIADVGDRALGWAKENALDVTDERYGAENAEIAAIVDAELAFRETGAPPTQQPTLAAVGSTHAADDDSIQF